MRLRCVSCYDYIKPEEVLNTIKKTEIEFDGTVVKIGLVRCYGCGVPFDSFSEEMAYYG